MKIQNIFHGGGTTPSPHSSPLWGGEQSVPHAPFSAPTAPGPLHVRCSASPTFRLVPNPTPLSRDHSEGAFSSGLRVGQKLLEWRNGITISKYISTQKIPLLCGPFQALRPSPAAGFPRLSQALNDTASGFIFRISLSIKSNINRSVWSERKSPAVVAT